MSEPLDLDPIKARAAELDRVESGHHDLGTRYIASSRSASDIPALIAEVEHLRELLEFCEATIVAVSVGIWRDKKLNACGIGCGSLEVKLVEAAIEKIKKAKGGA